MQTNFQELKNFLDEAHSIVLFGHQSIDGDCIGSMLSFGKICEKLGKKVKYHTPDKPDKCYNFLPGLEKISTNFIYEKYDLFVFLDFSTYDRISAFTKDNVDYFKKTKTIVIDHHLDDNSNANLSVKKKDASSNCERLLTIYESLRPKHIDQDIATYLYTGLLTDTGNITYENDTHETLQNASRLIKYGAKKREIIYHLFRKRNLNTMNLLEKTLSRLKTQNQSVLYSYYIDQERKDLKLGSGDTDYITYTLQNISGYGVFALFKVYKDYLKISLRSRRKEENPYGVDINVGLIAKNFNGGGHVFAAGTAPIPIHGSIEDTIKKIVEKIESEVEKQIQTIKQ